MFKPMLFSVCVFFMTCDSAYSLTCSEIGDILGGEVSQHENVCDIFVARNNISSVLEGFTLQPEIGIGLEVSVIDNTFEGAIAVLETEAQIAAKYLEDLDFTLLGLNNHFLLEQPKVFFVHFAKRGEQSVVAAQIRQLTDLIGGFGPPDKTPISILDPVVLNNALGLDGEIKAGGVYKADFTRCFAIRSDGAKYHPECHIAIQGMMDNALLVGEVALQVFEMAAFLQNLVDNNLRVAAIHNHEIDEVPRIYYVHFEQTGVAEELANLAKLALNTMQK